MHALKTYLMILGLCLAGMVPFGMHAQELKATIAINTQQLDPGYNDRFETLKSKLEEFVNGRNWTAAQFQSNERINCTMALTITEVLDNDRYRANIIVQSNRPVFNASYNTAILNWQDENFVFEYTEGQNLTFNEYNLDNELVATIAYYVYLLLGLDFDSFAPNGGKAFLQRAEGIVSQMQGSDNACWKAFADKKNRHALISALTDERQSVFHEMWYKYHREGLDQMSLSVDKGRAAVTQSCRHLNKIRQTDVQTPLLNMFISAKLDELLNIYSKAPRREKEDAYKILSEEYPTYLNRLNKITE